MSDTDSRAVGAATDSASGSTSVQINPGSSAVWAFITELAVVSKVKVSTLLTFSLIGTEAAVSVLFSTVTVI